MDEWTAAEHGFQRRFRSLSLSRSIDAVLPKPRVGLVLVGGPRNPSGKVAAETRNSLLASFKALERVQRRLS